MSDSLGELFASFNVGLVSHASAAIAFTALTLLLVASWRGQATGIWLVMASGATALWAVGGAVAFRFDLPRHPCVGMLLTLRGLAWLLFLLQVLPIAGADAPGRRTQGRLAAVLLALALIGLDGARLVVADEDALVHVIEVKYLLHLVMAVACLILVENLFRNSNEDGRWAIKYLCFAVGGIFAFDFYIYADGLLFHSVSTELVKARGAISALVVPLLAVSAARNPQWSLDVFVSRRVVFHTTSLLGAGGYLLLMSAAGFYLREFGGDWGTVLQATFLFAALILLCAFLFSGRLRTQFKVLLNKHFYNYRYDYRSEWLRFIATLSGSGSEESLNLRVVKAIADIVDSPDGALWVRAEGDGFVRAANWHFAAPEAVEPRDGPFARFLEQRAWIIDLSQTSQDPAVDGRAVLPTWVGEAPRAWLILPLLHDEQLLGFIVLGRPRANRQLNWEDYDLLKTVSRQAASYLAVQEVAKALADVRQFEEFNQRFAYVVHDIKNLVSQLSLLVKNAARHKHNPEFQEDMLRTIEHSVDKMQHFLARLHSDRIGEADKRLVRLEPVLRQLVQQRAATRPAIAFESRAADLALAADQERLVAVVDHLIQNAIDATGPDGHVALRLAVSDGHAVIEVEDDGPGMDADFVRNQLFRPFRSTKGTGYGIGAHEAREFARGQGGRMEVDSRPGEGTRMRLWLPIGRQAPAAAGTDMKVAAQ